jgi:hypothetical protein
VTDLVSIAPKLANCIRRLASDRDGEVVAAAAAMIRLLKTIGADIHDVADRIEHSGNGALNEAEMQEVYDAGIKEGIRRVEQKMRSQAPHASYGSPGSPQFPAPVTMAFYCYERIGRLNEWEQEFATNMMSWTRRRPLSVKQQARLEELYVKLGGRI